MVKIFQRDDIILKWHVSCILSFMAINLVCMTDENITWEVNYAYAVAFSVNKSRHCDRTLCARNENNATKNIRTRRLWLKAMVAVAPRHADGMIDVVCGPVRRLNDLRALVHSALCRSTAERRAPPDDSHKSVTCLKSATDSLTISLAVEKRLCDCCVGQFWPNITGRRYCCVYCRSVFNHCDAIGPQCCRIRWNNAK